MPAPSPIDSYIAAQPPAARRELKRMRTAIRAVAPDAIEVFSYRMPGSSSMAGR